MAITIINNNQQWAFNKMQSALVPQVLEVTSTNKANANFRYVFKITVNGSFVGEFQVRPSGVTLNGYFDFSNIVVNFFKESTFKTNFVTNTNDLIVNKSLINDSSFIAETSIDICEFDGVNVSAIMGNILIYLYNGYPVADIFSSSQDFGKICDYDKIFSVSEKNKIFWQSQTSATLVPMRIKFINLPATNNVSIIQQDEYGNDIGSAILKNISQPNIIQHQYIGGTDNSHKISFGGSVAQLFSHYKMSLTIDGVTESIRCKYSCKPFIELYYKNRLGAFEQFVFFSATQQNNIARKSYVPYVLQNFVQRSGEYSAAIQGGQFCTGYRGYVLSNSKTYDIEVQPTLKLVRQLTDETEHSAYVELLNSNLVYLCVPIDGSLGVIYGHKFIPVVINTTSNVYWRKHIDKATVIQVSLTLPSYKTHSN